MTRQELKGMSSDCKTHKHEQNTMSNLKYFQGSVTPSHAYNPHSQTPGFTAEKSTKYRITKSLTEVVAGMSSDAVVRAGVK